MPRLAPEVAALGAELDSVLANPAFARATWGVVVQSAASGQVLYRRNAERLLVPASNLKLLTASAALARLGADFRWTTTVLARGSRQGDTLVGDLLVVGRGDPTFAVDATGDSTDELRSLRPWVDSLASRGIRVVRGRIVGDASAFSDPPLGRGWAWDDLDADYAAPVGALQFNESVAWVEVTPGPVSGTAASLLLVPRAAPLRLFGTVATAPAEPDPRNTTILRAPRTPASAAPGATAPPDSTIAQLTWSRAPFGDSVAVGGRLPAGRATVRLPVAVPDPARYFEAALTETLEEGGVAVLGAPAESDLSDANVLRAARTPAAAVPGTTAPAASGAGTAGAPAAAETLFTWQSPPLSEVLPLLLKPSQNQIGETLLRTLGLQIRGVGSVDSGRAVMRDVLTEFGVPPDAYVLADGSGLSRYNDVAPEAIAAVLAAMYRRPDFPAFLEALPVAGVDGTLATRLQGTAAAGNAHAKTGSMSGVRTLSGYVRTPSGETLLFVLLANNVTAPRRVVEAAQDQIVARLATFARR